MFNLLNVRVIQSLNPEWLREMAERIVEVIPVEEVISI